jgi:hypothetical protein
VTTSGAPGSQVVFGRTGANDPSFNLISEPLMLVRRRAASTVFASAIEPHGFFSEPEERSADAVGVVRAVNVLADDAEGTVAEVTGANGLRWVVMVSNGPASKSARHRVGSWEWVGDCSVQGVR